MNKLEKTIDDYVKRAMFYQDIPGISIIITNENETIYSQGFGFINIAGKDPITERTIFHMASITKLFVATAMMQLVEKGKININERLIYYIPGFVLKDKRHKDITILHLLSHTSGIPDCADYGWEEAEYDQKALNRYVHNLEDLRLLFQPGNKFQYSNIAYEILGYLIEVISEKEFEAYVDEHILRPLDMKDSTLLYRDKHYGKIAAPHTKNQEKKVVQSRIYPYHRAHAPSSTLTSNAVDMSKWAIMNLNRGIFNGNRILQESSYQQMWTPVASMKGEQEKIGLGWFISKHNHFSMLGHDGSDIGFRSSFGMIPEKNLSIGIFANIDNISTRRIMRSIFDILLETPEKN
ncbi:CubicO group peptidase, beta-lactamase class C family [Anaerovirgula multivorans]|uniref:CubicO group peptidase, beta-lactamase class C family n=1 Tax=Anaerovirgula multivorans TaxID=312168 RepID=A0A239J0W8_9FIRM|nr:serine hydrolase domain-containing protein [Anaerovirgula multivorans]SNS99480.1 CubicO group peptidase, beta-lactamase class C family [Anaerovirgula multivorans]